MGVGVLGDLEFFWYMDRPLPDLRYKEVSTLKNIDIPGLEG